VAFLADDFSVRPCQRIVGLPRMIEPPRHPYGRRVTLVAFRFEPQSTRMSCVLMTFRALQGRADKGARRMACLADRFQMGVDQWKFGLVVVEANFSAPVLIVVAVLASISEAPQMRISRAMAGDAVCLQLLRVNIALVTCVAEDLRVRPFQRELRLRVIKFRFLPLRDPVAGIAFRSVAPAVDVLDLVAGHAFSGDVLVELA